MVIIMGKRKRRANHSHLPVSYSPPDIIPCTVGMDLSTEVRSPPCVSPDDYTTVHPCTSFMDTTDSLNELQNGHSSHARHHYDLSRAMFLRRSHHKYGNRYARRNSGSQVDTLRALCRGASPLCHEKLSLKFASRCSSKPGYHGDRRPFHRPERVKSIPLVMTSINATKMVCGLCRRLLRRKANAFSNPLLSGDLSVVAILVCGHVYHGDCLDERTSEADSQDPPCPLCVEWPPKVDASGGQE